MDPSAVSCRSGLVPCGALADCSRRGSQQDRNVLRADRFAHRGRGGPQRHSRIPIETCKVETLLRLHFSPRDRNKKKKIKYYIIGNRSFQTKIDVNKKNFNGNTALHTAVVTQGAKAREICALLMKYGADPYIRNNSRSERVMGLLMNLLIGCKIVQQFSTYSIIFPFL